MRVLGLSGSLRGGSHNTRLLHGAARCWAPGVELVVFERLGEIPPYSEDSEHEQPPAVAELKAAIAAADGVLIATPEYNASIPGVLKNALDWVSRPLADDAAGGQAGGGDRREHGPVRSGLGAGGDAQGARRDRRARARPRAADRRRPTRRSATTGCRSSSDAREALRRRSTSSSSSPAPRRASPRRPAPGGLRAAADHLEREGAASRIRRASGSDAAGRRRIQGPSGYARSG